MADFNKILVSTDEITGSPSVFAGWCEVEQMYRELNWDGDPSEQGIMSVAEYIDQQRRCGSVWDTNDWLAHLRAFDGVALDEFSDDELLVSISAAIN